MRPAAPTPSPLWLLLAVMPACYHPPLDYEENRPAVQDAVIDRDVVVHGKSRLYFWDDDDYVCTIEADIQGWVAEDVTDNEVGCAACSENFTLAFARNDEGDCGDDVRMPAGAASLALTPMDYFVRSSNPDLYDYLLEWQPEGADGDIVAYVQTNWSPWGQVDWGIRMGLFEPEDAVGLETYAREYFAVGLYRWGFSDGTGFTWDMDLWLVH